MENRSDLFYQYYDDLYFSKNYSEETGAVISSVKKYLPRKIRKALEIGCGTGNHTLEFARYDFQLTSIDIDRKMIKAAVKKITRAGCDNVKLLHVPVEKLDEDNFDFAVAGFNVVNYLPDFNSLISFFTGINKRLVNGGVFIFDCWNGAAALMDPPGTKTIHCRSSEKFVRCTIESETDFLRQKTLLKYNLSIKNRKGDDIENGIFSFEQTLWTPFEVEYCIKNSGLKILRFSKPFQPDAKATEKDWKVMYICKRKKTE